MPLPKLSLLQPRLAASPIASIMLLMLYISFLSHSFAYATDIDSIRPEDHNHDRWLETDAHRPDIQNQEPREEGAYRAEFLGYDEGITGRALELDSATPLENNLPKQDNLAQGQTNFYTFPSTQLKLRVRDTDSEDEDTLEEIDKEMDTVSAELGRRQRATTSQVVYISVNVCSQPKPQEDTTVNPPPQVKLYISQSENNRNPGPDSKGDQESFELVEGATMRIVNATGDIYIGLHGPKTTNYKEMWNAEIGASTDNFYHTYIGNSGPNLNLVDSDSKGALLISGNLTNENASSPVYKKIMDSPPPYVLFASSSKNRAVQGLRNSYCGLLQNADVKPLDTGENPGNIQASLTTRGRGSPRQQFYLNEITSGTTYTAFLAVHGGGNSSSAKTRRAGVIGGGGQIWRSINFTTLSDGNCAVVYDLSFCDQTAYAVPTNAQNFTTMKSLASFYDNATSEYYNSFKNALAQVPCNTTASAQYSLARNCDDCAAAYKNWLCAVNIPRCADYSSESPWLQPRNVVSPYPNGTALPDEITSFANQSLALRSSRNPQIDQFIMPGPYKEVLPCDSLCYNIVQSCPPSLGFGCPQPGNVAFNSSYGIKSDLPGGELTCNYPGAEFAAFISQAGRTAQPLLWMILVSLMMMILQFV